MLLVRLARIGERGAERQAAWDGSHWRDLTEVTNDRIQLPRDSDLVADALTLGDLPILSGNARFGPPVSPVGKIVCIGLNFRDHAAETGAEIPSEPVMFLKAADTIIGPDDDVLIPRGSSKTDWEVELGVVIGETARYLESPADSAAHVAGYLISHDVSERSFQLERGGQWDKGKNCETFCPIGPWLVTPDELANVQELGMRLWVNGVQRQTGSTRDMIFDVAHLIWYVSQFLVLHPNDIISTGTPSGVAMATPAQPYLREDDRVTVEIDGLGRQEQRIGQA